MEDKVLPVDGQAPEAPETEKTPEVVQETESPIEVDKDLTEWATNKGYSEDDLKDEKVQKAVKMAMNAEQFAGRKQSQSAEVEEMNLDEFLDSLITTEEPKSETVTETDIDLDKLSPAEKAVLSAIEKRAEDRARAVIAPFERERQKLAMKLEFTRLTNEYGEDFTKNAPDILKKMKSSPGISAEDATVAVLAKQLINKGRQAGFKAGEKAKETQVQQQVERTKKSTSSFSLDEFSKLSVDEQEKILRAIDK